MSGEKQGPKQAQRRFPGAGKGWRRAAVEVESFLGRTFGRLTILQVVDPPIVLARCACGRERQIPHWLVTRGRVGSCGERSCADALRRLRYAEAHPPPPLPTPEPFTPHAWVMSWRNLTGICRLCGARFGARGSCRARINERIL